MKIVQDQVPFLWLWWVKIALANTCNSTIIEMCDYMIRVSQWLKECQMLRDMAKSNLDFSLLLKLEWILGFSGMLKNIIFRVEWEWGPVCLSQKFKNRRKIVWMLGMVLGMKLFPNKKGFRISSNPLILLWRERRDLNSRPPAWQARGINLPHLTSSS